MPTVKSVLMSIWTPTFLVIATITLAVVFSSRVPASAETNIQVIEMGSENNSIGRKAVTANCPIGKAVLGAGGKINSLSGNYDQIHLYDVGGNGQRTSVTVKASEDSDGYVGNWQVVAIAFCG